MTCAKSYNKQWRRHGRKQHFHWSVFSLFLRGSCLCLLFIAGCVENRKFDAGVGKFTKKPDEVIQELPIELGGIS